MTSRIGKPDTAADVQLKELLDQSFLSSFVMVAGAGSGKTTSLIKALDHLGRTRGRDLRRNGQKIACITYTDIAVKEILGDIGNATLFHISTIHSFLWAVVRPFQNDIRIWVANRIDEKISKAREKISKPKTQPKTRENLTLDIARYQEQFKKLNGIPHFSYEMGSDYANGILGHDDILKIGPELITEKPLLRTLIASRFPFIFVDESQDTIPLFVDALKKIEEAVGKNFCLGFFGDPMQKIYLAGAGSIALGNKWSQITKPENFRCPINVLGVINRIRAEDDKLEQIRGGTVDHSKIVKAIEGTARLFILPADEQRSTRLAVVRSWLAKENQDPLWESDSNEANVRVLVLVHRMAALRLGFADIYAALNDNNAGSLKYGLLDGTAWVLRPFIAYILPMVLSARASSDFDVITALRIHCPLLSKEYLTGQDAVKLLAELRIAVAGLVGLFEKDESRTIKEVLIFIRDQKLARLDDRFIRFLDEPSDEEIDSQDTAVNAFLNCPANQLFGYLTYIEDQSPFATQHGIKGAEFQRVLVILDDEESAYNLYSYDKYLGITPLSDTDDENIEGGKDSVLSRTRRLFYVCCSRATKDLAIVLFASDVHQAKIIINQRQLFPVSDVHLLEDFENDCSPV